MKINKNFYGYVGRAVCKNHELYSGAARSARSIVGPCLGASWIRKFLGVKKTLLGVCLG